MLQYEEKRSPPPSVETIPDEEIIIRVLNGDKECFELIMRKYNQRLYKICRAYVRNDDEVEDIIQEAYVKAYWQLPAFEGRAKFSTWLIRILINEALGYVRRQRRYASLNLQDSDNNPQSGVSGIWVSDVPTPAETTMNLELKEILEHAIDELPEKYRVVYMMREIEEMSVAETSQSLAITESNVKVRLNRAKEMLREHITRFYRGAEVFEFNLVRCDRIVKTVFARVETYRSASLT